VYVGAVRDMQYKKKEAREHGKQQRTTRQKKITATLFLSKWQGQNQQTTRDRTRGLPVATREKRRLPKTTKGWIL